MRVKKFLSMCLVGVTAVSLLAGCSSGNSGQSGDAQQETQTEAQSTNAAQNEADTSTASTPDTAVQDLRTPWKTVSGPALLISSGCRTRKADKFRFPRPEK